MKCDCGKDVINECYGCCIECWNKFWLPFRKRIEEEVVSALPALPIPVVSQENPLEEAV